MNAPKSDAELYELIMPVFIFSSIILTFSLFLKKKLAIPSKLKISSRKIPRNIHEKKQKQNHLRFWGLIPWGILYDRPGGEKRSYRRKRLYYHNTEITYVKRLSRKTAYFIREILLKRRSRQEVLDMLLVRETEQLLHLNATISNTENDLADLNKYAGQLLLFNHLSFRVESQRFFFYWSVFDIFLKNLWWQFMKRDLILLIISK